MPYLVLGCFQWCLPREASSRQFLELEPSAALLLCPRNNSLEHKGSHSLCLSCLPPPGRLWLLPSKPPPLFQRTWHPARDRRNKGVLSSNHLMPNCSFSKWKGQSVNNNVRIVGITQNWPGKEDIYPPVYLGVTLEMDLRTIDHVPLPPPPPPLWSAG